MEYFGYRISNDVNDITKIYSDEYDTSSFKENEYLIIENEGEGVDYFCYKENKLVPIKYPVIESSFCGKIKPRNPQQYCAMDLLKDMSVPVKLITGKFGTGKTLICIAEALEQLTKGNFEKIVFVRNNVQVKDTDQLGALPGGEEEKMLPYVMPFADHCGGIDGIKILIDQQKLEVIPLGFLRGRSIRNAILYSMESENLTKEHIQLLMGRIDEGSQLWLDGDIKQRDKAVFEKSKGLEMMIEKLGGHRLFGYVHLLKSERSEVSQMADLLD